MSFSILLVDDEPMIKLSLRKIITDTHPDFVIAGDAMDGREALELAERTRPHVIVTDISMPVMGGLELIRAVHERGWRPEIVILSGDGEFDYAREALKYGVADYILKPMRPAAVKELMLGLYAKHRERIDASKAMGELRFRCLRLADLLVERIRMVDEPGIRSLADETVRAVTDFGPLADEQKKDVLLDAAAAPSPVRGAGNAAGVRPGLERAAVRDGGAVPRPAAESGGAREKQPELGQAHRDPRGGPRDTGAIRRPGIQAGRPADPAAHVRDAFLQFVQAGDRQVVHRLPHRLPDRAGQGAARRGQGAQNLRGRRTGRLPRLSAFHEGIQAGRRGHAERIPQAPLTHSVMKNTIT